jgi:hypothetical protein
MKAASAGGAGVMKGKPTGKAAVYDKGVFVARYGGGDTMGITAAQVSPGGRTRMSGKQINRLNKSAEVQKSAIRAKNDVAGARYDALAKAGKVRSSTGLESLRRTAAGHSDNASVQAAQRLLAKREARMKAGAPAKSAKPLNKAPKAPPKPATKAPKLKGPNFPSRKQSRDPYANLYARFGIK